MKAVYRKVVLIATLWVFCGSAFGDDPCLDNGTLEQDLADCTKAIERLKQSEKNDLVGTRTYNERAALWTKKGEYDQALADSNESLRLTPDGLDALLTRGIAYQLKRQLDFAKADYDKVLIADPKNAIAYALRGSLFGMMDNLDAAIADSTKAIALLAPSIQKDQTELNSRIGRVFYNRGLALKLKGDYVNAIGDYRAAIEINPADPHSWSKRVDGLNRKDASSIANTLYEDVVFSPVLNTSDKRIFSVQDTLKTRFGNLLLFKTNILPAHMVMLNGQVIYEGSELYASIFGYFQAGATDVVLLGANPGGSGTPDTTMSFLIIRSPTKFETLSHPEFVADRPDGIESKMDKSGRIFVNLGYRDANEMRGELVDGKLYVRKIAHPHQSLKNSDCKWLYDVGRGQCSSNMAKENGCARWAKDAGIYTSSSDMGRFSSITDQPGYEQAEFDKACFSWCEERRIAYKDFSKKTCSSK